jgi:hypothetical protein
MDFLVAIFHNQFWPTQPERQVMNHYHKTSQVYRNSHNLNRPIFGLRLIEAAKDNT